MIARRACFESREKRENVIIIGPVYGSHKFCRERVKIRMADWDNLFLKMIRDNARWRVYDGNSSFSIGKFA